MGKRLRRFGLLLKSLSFTLAIHGVLLTFLFYSFNWKDNTIKRGDIVAIEAVAVPDPDIAAQKAAQKLEEEKKLEELKRAEEARKQKEQAAEKKRLEEEKQKKVAEEKKRKAEQKRKADEQKKKVEAEQKRKAEAEKKKQAAEKKRKAEELKKKQAAEKKRKEEKEKRERAEQLRKQLEKEQRAKTQTDAADALSALVDRIAAAVERNWRRPSTSQAGLTVTIRVKVARDGRVTSARVTRSSGDSFFDQSAERAVHKASPLPFPANPEYYEFINEFDFRFNPDAL